MRGMEEQKFDSTSELEVFTPLSDPLLDDEDLRSVAHLENLTLGVANGPVMAGNQISISAEGSTNTRIAGVVFEKHIHYGSSISNSSGHDSYNDEQSDPEYGRSSREIFSSLVKYYINQYSWMTAWDGGPRYSTEDLYIGLKMQLLDRSGRFKHGDPSKKKILFEPFSRTGVTPRTVLIRGDPGSGKTVLCRKIAYDWAGQGKTFPWFRSDRTVVLYLDLTAMPEDAVLDDELLRLAVRKDSADAEELDKARQNLASFGKHVILVLDGYVGVGTRLKQQVIRLVTSATASSPFCDASVIVTTRSDVDEETLGLFQKNFFMKGFSMPMIRRLVDKLFKNSADARGSRALEFFQRYQLKGLSPSAILALCRCDSRKSKTEEILQEWILRLVKSCGQPICDDEIWRKVERLGEFLWKRIGRTRDFRLEEMQTSLGDDCQFFLNCRLLKTAEIGSGGERLTWTPVADLLSDEIAAFYVQRRWASCVNPDQVTLFLSNLFPRLPCLNVDCSLNPEGEKNRFRISFRYRQFQLVFNIYEGGKACFVRSNVSSSKPDEENHVIQMSYMISLRRIQDAEEVLYNLIDLLQDSETLSWIYRFLSPSRFENVNLRIKAEATSVAYSLLNHNFVMDNFTIPNPLSTLRRRGRELHLTLVKTGCELGFVSSVLKNVLDIDESLSSFSNAIDIVENLKTTTLTPSFQAAHIYGQQYIRPKPDGCVPNRKICDRLELFFHSDSKTEEYFDGRYRGNSGSF